MATYDRCTAYLRGRGVFQYSGRRCDLAAGHTGQHETPTRSLDPRDGPVRWGRRPLTEI
jgi:hypothetical protein